MLNRNVNHRTPFVVVVLIILLALFANGSAALAQKRYTIGVSMPEMEGPFFTGLMYGIYQRAEERGVDLVVLSAGGYSNIGRQISQMEDLIIRRVDGILLDPADDQALSPMVDMATSAGIPVVGAGSPIDNPNIISDVAVDNKELGRAMGRWLVEALNGRGTVAVLAGPPAALWSTYRYEGLTEVLADHPGIEIVGVQWSDPSRATALRITEDFLTRFPNLDALYAADDALGQGVGDAVLAMGKAGDIKIVTAVLGQDTERMIREGVITASVALQLVEIGRVSVDTILAVLEGQPVERHINIPTVTVTRDNIDQIDIGLIRQPEGWRP